MQLKDARVLIIGGTGVLGGRLATSLVGEGANVVLSGRQTERVEKAAEDAGAKGSVVLDLLDVESIPDALDQASETLGGLDAVIVASGLAAFGGVDEETAVVAEELFAVNALGPMVVLAAAAQRMERGTVAAITGIIADLPTAGIATYGASKAALGAYLTATRKELRRRKITVFEISPPHMDTGLVDRAIAGTPPKMGEGADVDAVVARIVEGLGNDSTRLSANVKTGQTELS